MIKRLDLRGHKLACGLAGAVLLGGYVQAQDLEGAYDALRRGEATEMEAERVFWQQQWDGWGGIALRCFASPDTDWTRAICERAHQRLRLLAASASIPFVYAGQMNAFQFGRLSSGGDVAHPLPLVIQVSATTGDLVGVHVRVAASPFYIDAIETNARSDAPEAAPKSGDLILWERFFIASGSLNAELRGLVHENLETLLLEFLALWSEHR